MVFEIKNWSKSIDFNQKEIENRSNYKISTSDFESDRFHHPNLLESNFKSSTIRFGTPNCLSLPFSVKIGKYLHSANNESRLPLCFYLPGFYWIHIRWIIKEMHYAILCRYMAKYLVVTSLALLGNITLVLSFWCSVPVHCM